MGKCWTRRLLASALGLLLGIILCEGIVRIFGVGVTTVSRGRLHHFDPEAGWTCLPDCDTFHELPHSFRVRIRCNSQGMRDREHTLEKPHGVRRIVVLGDSFMWGYGVENEEMFSVRLQSELPGYETLNFGVNGYGTVQALVRLERDALAYDPDWGVLAVCWNDLEDNFDDKDGGRPVVQLADDGSLAIANCPVHRPWKSGAKQWLRHNSRLFNFLEYAVATHRMRQKMADRAATETPHAGGSTEDTRALESSRAMSLSLLDLYARPTVAIDRAWDAAGGLIAKVRDQLEGNGARLVVVFVPVRAASTRAAFEVALVNPYASDGSELELDWDRPGRRLAGICRSLDVLFVDLQSAFRVQSEPDRLFLVRNNHWSVAGHAFAARIVAGAIRSLDPAPDDGQSR